MFLLQKEGGKKTKKNFQSKIRDHWYPKEISWLAFNERVLQEAEILREKYPWIPKKEDLLRSAEKLYHDFALSEAKTAIEEAESL